MSCEDNIINLNSGGFGREKLNILYYNTETKSRNGT